MKTYLERRLEETRVAYKIPLYSDSIGRLIDNLTKTSTTAIDLGMNIGDFGLEYSDKFDNILGVEASKLTIKEATKNLSDRKNIYFIHRAMHCQSNQTVPLRRVAVNGQIESGNYTTIPYAVSDSKNLESSGFSDGGIEEYVISISYVDLLHQFNLSKVAFLKVDIEGSEYDSLMGVDLSKTRFAVIELHYNALGVDKCRALLKHFDNFFHFYIPMERKYITSGWPPPQIIRLVGKNENYLRLFLSRTIFALSKILSLIKRHSQDHTK